jgi:uncharacterized membrane protein
MKTNRDKLIAMGAKKRPKPATPEQKEKSAEKKRIELLEKQVKETSEAMKKMVKAVENIKVEVKAPEVKMPEIKIPEPAPTHRPIKVIKVGKVKRDINKDIEGLELQVEYARSH